MELPTDKQVEIYDFLDARHTVTDKGVDNLSWEQILEMNNIIKR